MRLLPAGLCVLLVTASGGVAAPLPPPPLGKAFACRIHSDFDKLSTLTIWYGPNRRGDGSLPQVDDPDRVFALGGLDVGKEVTFWVKDEWPVTFTLNYFEKRGQGQPTSLLAVGAAEGDGEIFPVQVATFSLGTPRTGSGNIRPEKVVRGMCRFLPEISFAEFRNGQAK